jgi:hypothetical protein
MDFFRPGADLAVASAGERQDFFHALGQAIAIQAAHQAEHQLHGAVGAGGAEAVAVEGETGWGDAGLRAALRQAGALFGVDAAAVVVEHAGPAEEPGTVPQPAQGHAVAGAVVQQAVELGVLQRCAQAAADDQQVEFLEFAGGKFAGDQFQAQVAQHPVTLE